jgi:hypothetical protein
MTSNEGYYMKLKWIGFFSLVIIALFGYIYTLTLMPKNSSFFIMLILLGIIIFEMIQEGRKEQLKTSPPMVWKDAVRSFIFVVIGVLIPYYMSAYLNIHVVIGSAFVGLLFHFIYKKYEVEVYCGSFAGMISFLLIGPFEILLVALITGIIYVLAKPVWKGFGGKLGTIAFVGTISTLYLLNKPFLTPNIVINEVQLVLFAIGGVVITYVIQHHFKQTATLASSSISLAVALITQYILQLDPVYMTVLFAASFVGMSDKDKISNIFTAGLAGFIIGYMYIQFAPHLNGAGGKLGTMAFLTTICVHGINELILLSKKNHVSKERK